MKAPWLTLAVLVAMIPAPADARLALRGGGPGEIQPGAPGSVDRAPSTPPLESRVRLTMMPDSSNGEPKRSVTVYDGGEDRWVERFEWPRVPKVNLSVWARYTSVEGLAAHVRFYRPLSRNTFMPSYEAEGGFAFAGDFGKLKIGFEQPLVRRNRLTVGLEGYRDVVASFYGDEIIGTSENTASTFFLRKDYRDWYEVQGGRGYVGIHPSPFLTAKAGIRAGEEETLENEAGFSVFNGSDSFRENPAIQEGDYFGYFAEIGYDSRPKDSFDADVYPRSAWGPLEYWLRLSWDRSDPSAREDFDEWMATADLRTYVRLNRRQWLSVRALGGKGSAGLSPQRRYVLGGIGTLHGQNFKSIAGDRVAMANAQYFFGLTRKLQATFFADAGSAWDQGSLFDQRILVDLGTGLRVGRGTSLVVAKNVNRSESEVKVVLRLEDTF